MKYGYTLLYVGDVKTTMDFYEAAFGLEKAFLHESGEYGEMGTGETKLGFVGHQTASSHGFEYAPVKANQPAPGFELGFLSSNVESD